MNRPFTIGILASGSGSNAEKIIDFFKPFEHIQISFIASNKKTAKVLERAQKHNIAHFYFKNSELKEESILERFKTYPADALILAGFLAKIPAFLIDYFQGKMLNIHPSLLPKYGGKGMYGHHVHQAVFDGRESSSGMTIHMVNNEYDKGKILFQASTNIGPEDQADDIGKKVLRLEHFHYPRVIKQWIKSMTD